MLRVPALVALLALAPAAAQVLPPHVPAPNQALAVDLIITLDGPADAGALAQLSQLGSIRHTYRSFDGLLLATQQGHVQAIGQLPGVVRIDPDRPLHPHLDRAHFLTRLDTAPLPTGPGASIAVVDSGIDGTHPDLAGRVAESVTVTASGVQAGGHDEKGHGTFVASAAAGSGQASPHHSGANPVAQLVAVDLGERWTEDRAIRAFEWVMENAGRLGVRVVLLSAGTGIEATGFDAGAPLARTASALDRAGLLLVVSGGNGGAMSNLPLAPNVLAVGAVDAAGRPAAFNSYAPEGISKPDLFAPGVGLVAARANAPPGGSLYVAGNGSSGAAAYVAGVASRYWAMHPQASNEEVRTALRGQARAGPAGPMVDALALGVSVEPSRVLAFEVEASPVQLVATVWSERVRLECACQGRLRSPTGALYAVNGSIEVAAEPGTWRFETAQGTHGNWTVMEVAAEAIVPTQPRDSPLPAWLAIACLFGAALFRRAPRRSR